MDSEPGRATRRDRGIESGPTSRRRRFLLGAATLATTGAAGCLAGIGGEDSCDPGQITVETPDGAFGETETALWNWPKHRTDGGAFGPLGEAFDVEAVHRAEATVDGTTMQRSGVDRWLLVDGADPGNPVELANFDDDSGDLSCQLSDNGE